MLCKFHISPEILTQFIQQLYYEKSFHHYHHKFELKHATIQIFGCKKRQIIKTFEVCLMYVDSFLASL